MSRVSAPRRAVAGRPRLDPPRSWRAALAWAGGAAVLVLAAFLAHPLLEGYRFPLGPDGPVYVWWARLTEVAGLEAVRRPGVPALTLPLTTLLASDPLHVVAVLEPTLAVAVALAAGALAEGALGPDRARFAAAVLIVGAFAGFLAAGWLANLALAALFLAALAALAPAERGWPPIAFAAACLAAGGVAHALFLAVSLAVIAGMAVLLAPRALRDVRSGVPLLDTAPIRLTVAATAGAGGALLALAPLAEGARAPGDTSQDQVFRRLGLDLVLRERFRERLGEDLRRLAAPLGIATAAAAWVGRPPAPADGWRYSVALAASWTAVTAAGIAALWATGLAPAGRFLTFAYVVPLVAAVAAAAALRRGGAIRLVALALVATFAVASLWGWYRQTPFMSDRELRAVRSLGPTLDALPPGTPLVFVVDTGEFAAAFHVARFGNVIRAGLPAERVDDARLVVGSPEDALLGRPGTASEDPEYQRLAAAYLDAAGPVLERAAIFVLAPFNREGFSSATRLGRVLAGDAVLLRGPEGAAVAPDAPPPDPGFSPWAWSALSLVTLALLAVLGGGWAAWALARAGSLAILGAAPAAGLAVLIAGTLAADRLSLAPAGAGAALAGAVAVLGYVLAARHQPVDAVEDA